MLDEVGSKFADREDLRSIGPALGQRPAGGRESLDVDPESEPSLSSLDEEDADVESTTESDSPVSELDSSESDDEAVREGETSCDPGFRAGKPTNVMELAAVAGTELTAGCFPPNLDVTTCRFVVILGLLALR